MCKGPGAEGTAHLTALEQDKACCWRSTQESKVAGVGKARGRVGGGRRGGVGCGAGWQGLWAPLELETSLAWKGQQRSPCRLLSQPGLPVCLCWEKSRLMGAGKLNLWRLQADCRGAQGRASPDQCVQDAVLSGDMSTTS